MTNLRLIGAALLSLMLASPAMAMHHVYHHHYGQVLHGDLPVQDAIRLGHGSGYKTYHSGYGGLYGDGLYPGNVYENDHLDLPPSAPLTDAQITDAQNEPPDFRRRLTYLRAILRAAAVDHRTALRSRSALIPSSFSAPSPISKQI
jgi:hypothetical protein